jgi:hypothetical protein
MAAGGASRARGPPKVLQDRKGKHVYSPEAVLARFFEHFARVLGVGRDLTDEVREVEGCWWQKRGALGLGKSHHLQKCRPVCLVFMMPLHLVRMTLLPPCSRLAPRGLRGYTGLSWRCGKRGGRSWLGNEPWWCRCTRGRVPSRPPITIGGSVSSSSLARCMPCCSCTGWTR